MRGIGRGHWARLQWARSSEGPQSSRHESGNCVVFVVHRALLRKRAQKVSAAPAKTTPRAHRSLLLAAAPRQQPLGVAWWPTNGRTSSVDGPRAHSHCSRRGVPIDVALLILILILLLLFLVLLVVLVVVVVVVLFPSSLRSAGRP